MTELPFRIFPVLLTAALLVAGTVPLSAQSLTRGELGGVVTDEGGTPVRRATVSLRELVSGVSHERDTSTGGNFRFEFLPGGIYQLVVETLGFRPLHVEPVVVHAGETLRLMLTLSSAPPPVQSVDTLRLHPSQITLADGARRRRFSSLELAGLPETGRDLGQLARMSTLSSEEFDVEGLPAHLGGVFVDGLSVSTGRHPALRVSAYPSAGLPLSAFRGADMVTNGVDVEWAGSAGALLSGHTRTGTRSVEINAFGDWGSGARPGGPVSAVDAPDQATTQGGLSVSGSIVPDTATFVLGFEMSRLGAESALAYPGFSDIAAIALDSFGVSLGVGDLVAGEPASKLATAFGRFDWQLSAAHALSARGSFSSLSSNSREPSLPSLGGQGAELEGRDLTAGASLTSRFGALSQEARVGVRAASRDFSAPAPLQAEGDELDLVSTRFPAAHLVLGGGGVLPGLFDETALQARETLHLRTGRHQMKAGASAEHVTYEYLHAGVPEAEFVFSGPDAFASGRGSFIQTVGGVPAAEFSVTRLGAFLQDTWFAAPGLELTLGVRYDLETLPRGEVATNAEWLSLTGLANSDLRSDTRGFSPRAGFSWDVDAQRRWRMHGAVGVYRGTVDPGVLGELLTHDGRVGMRRGFGELARWPAPPEAAATPDSGALLTLAAPELRAPETVRGTLGLSRLLGGELALHLSGTYRRTEALPRRSDLNLLPTPLYEDQYGRAVFGRLQQEMGLLGVGDGSNRRFGEFDRVTAVNVDGWSEYRGVTATLERRPASGLGLIASYTYSRTRDNWPGAGRGGADASLPPFPAAEGDEDWSEGVSDLDVPHRALFGLETPLPGVRAVRVAGFYRFHSGYPFTPGFRDGVDANGDGSDRNDAAFVDGELPGMSELLGRWGCLRDQLGRLAERNSCRSESVHSLDARLSLDFLRLGRHTASLVIDGLNLFSSESSYLDHALLRVDDQGTLARDDSAGLVAVPLVANSGFGEPLFRLNPGRVVRLGIRVNH